MRKTVVTAAALLAFGTGMTSAWAAANPFEDVPADHWAYDAVAQLAADGVVEGYGDGTYRGSQEITRYEMAQMVARAMAKGNVSGADKAMIDKLAAEFADELNSLGVRVAALEKKVDNVRWNGALRYRYRTETEIDEGVSTRYSHQYVTFRLEPSVTINKHWTGHARIDYNTNMNTATNTPAVGITTEKRHLDSDIEYNGMRVERVWVEGNYGRTNIRLGKLPYKTWVDGGMIFDDNVSGGQITFGNKVKATLTIGRSKRFDGELGVDPDHPDNDTGSYQALEIYNDRADKITWGLAWHRWANRDLLKDDTNASKLNIYEVGLGYKFSKNLSLHGAYAWTNDADFDNDIPPQKIFSHSKKTYSIELDYKKADPADKGSFGIFVAYRHLGHYSSIAPTYDTVYNGRRGVEVGASYVFATNVMGTVKYFRGQKMPDDSAAPGQPRDATERDSVLFMELNYFF